MTQPTLETLRLKLRPFSLSDARDVMRLAGDRDIADTTLNIPHPYADGMAESWIETHKPGYETNSSVTFAVVLRDGACLVGAIGLTIDVRFNKAELGYWTGRPYWNKGYATEAAKAAVEFGFSDLRLNRIYARHLARNPSSGRVMEKIGMQQEGIARQDLMKWEKYEDMVLYGILLEDWKRA